MNEDQGKYQPLSYFQLMEVSLRELLVEKGIVTDDQVRATVEDMRSRGAERGAQVVARAWTDPAFKARLLADGTQACRDLGLDVPAKANVDVVGEYRPTMYGFDGFKKGTRPGDYELK